MSASPGLRLVYAAMVIMAIGSAIIIFPALNAIGVAVDETVRRGFTIPGLASSLLGHLFSPRMLVCWGIAVIAAIVAAMLARAGTEHRIRNGELPHDENQ